MVGAFTCLRALSRTQRTRAAALHTIAGLLLQESARTTAFLGRTRGRIRIMSLAQRTMRLLQFPLLRAAAGSSHPFSTLRQYSMIRRRTRARSKSQSLSVVLCRRGTRFWLRYKLSKSEHGALPTAMETPTRKSLVKLRRMTTALFTCVYIKPRELRQVQPL